MRSISTRLTLTLVVVALVAGAATAGAVIWSTSRTFSGYRVEQGDLRIAEVQQMLGAYYAARGSWDGVANLLAPGHEAMLDGLLQQHRGMGHGMGMGQGQGMGQGMGQGPGMGMGAMPTMIALMDLGAERVQLVGTDGRTIADTGGPVGAAVPPADLAGGLPITVGSQVVGTLLIDRPAIPPLSVIDAAYNRRTTFSAVASGLGAALVAGVVGLMLAGRIARPLQGLTSAAGRMARHDLTARVQVTGNDELAVLGTEFNRMAEELGRQEQLRRTMVADVAHELRTPVAILRSQFEAIQDGAAEATVETLLPMHDEVLRLTRLLDDLQILSLTDAGQLPLNRRPIDPGELAEQTASAFRAAAAGKGIDFQVGATGQPPIINADPDRIKQVLLNLLGNALRHTPPGGTIQLEVSSTANEVHFAVVDTGEGINPADLPHLFDRFYRGDKSRSRSGGGSGLGLAIARGIAESHGGSVSAVSTPGHGSRFTLSLPVTQA
jgi:signal transduction histidine kinase